MVWLAKKLLHKFKKKDVSYQTPTEKRDETVNLTNNLLYSVIKTKAAVLCK